ncbi:stage II sporulation protein P [Dethiobacter alkaliphilus]|uniref:Stage II sporulation protein P n=1 Tax=Dethiobacter alkaliphilus AHT 1 TaxID=555088 RepID=C0GDU4_DETAL|nr:stage II sporulation protein P [Dethiobacter alkaliphilus]EEG78577.1 stage II sporulation protein P [Dethiobacter alkaliphilus AHT 1]
MAKRTYYRRKRYYRNNRHDTSNLSNNIFLATSLLAAVAMVFSIFLTSIYQTDTYLDYFFEKFGLHVFSQAIPGFSYMVKFETDDFIYFTEHYNTDTEKEQAVEQPRNILEPISRNIVDEHNSEEPNIIIPVRNMANSGEVIIYHAHTTESFKPTSGSNFTSDLSIAVVRLGEELKRILQEEYGIPVVHDKTIHNIPHGTAYEKALPTITQLLEEYPDAKLVIDLHRDGQLRTVTTTNLNGNPTGKVMFVIGGRNNPYYRQNVRAAEFVDNRLEAINPNLTRGLLQRPQLNYNQHIHPNALLIEIGGNNNSLEEALRTIPYLAQAIAELYQADKQ